MAYRVSDPRPKPTFVHGLQYVMALREELAGEPGKFEEVLAVIREFKAGSDDSLDEVTGGYMLLQRTDGSSSKFAEALLRIQGLYNFLKASVVDYQQVAILEPAVSFILVKCLEVFKELYQARTKHRKLSWIWSLGTCNINANIYARPTEIVTIFQIPVDEKKRIVEDLDTGRRYGIHASIEHNLQSCKVMGNQRLAVELVNLMSHPSLPSTPYGEED